MFGGQRAMRSVPSWIRSAKAAVPARAVIDLVRLSSEKDRAEGRASFNDKTVDCTMMPEQLPPPTMRLNVRPVRGEVVAALVRGHFKSYDLSQETVD